MKRITCCLFVLSLFTLLHGKEKLPLTAHPAIDAYEGWRLAAQAYTFNRFSFFEAIDKTAAAGMDWIEAYPGQKLSAERSEAKMIHTMPDSLRQYVKNKLADAGLHLVNYGVVGLPNDEKECRQVFDFARAMGIETIVSEPKEEALALIDRLCQEYKIKVAIHNHPKPSHYWNPETVLAAVKGRSKWIGADADLGHWMRSGVQPIDGVRKLKGRIISLHSKDLNEFGVKEAHDVIWGTGKADLAAVLQELHQQKFQGVFSIEYEYNWENSLPEVRRCVEYFKKTAGALKPTGWQNLFSDDLSDAVIFVPNTWSFPEGVLTRLGGSYIYTKKQYGDFILDLEYKLSPNANSGVFLRIGNLRNVTHTGIEVQIHETTDGSPRGMNGAIYDCVVPTKAAGKKAGEWNHYTITCKANRIYVLLNGEQIIDMDLNRWTEAHKNPDGTANKFNTAYKDMPRVGHIGFQDHGQPIWFRNMSIRAL